MQWKMEKKFQIYEIMAFEEVTGISLNYDENTGNQQSTCYQTVWIFQIWLREMFSKLSLSCIKEKLG